MLIRIGNNTMDLQKLVDENQSIKIVPSIEDTLRSSGFNVDLGESALLWFSQLQRTWKTWKKSVTVENNIESFFQSTQEPFRLALALVIKCDEFKDCKPKSLPFCIIETLSKWSERNNVSPDEYLKLPAFKIAITQRNQSFFNLIVKTYQLSTIKEVILPMVHDIIEVGNYKQACQIIIAMKLFDDIPIDTVLFPLVLQDKHNIIDDYLTECPQQVTPFLLFLDNLLDKSFNIREYVQNYLENHAVGEIKYEKLHYKPLGKLVARLCNKYKVPIETCKNLSKNRTTGGLRYLIHQKYQEHNVSASVWEDLVKDSLKQNVGSAAEFIDMLTEYDRKEALKWAMYLNMPECDYPPGLTAIPTQSGQDEAEEDWDVQQNQEECYKLTLQDDQIILVDTGEKFYDMMNSNLTKSRVVSIDCEWKPSFGATQSQVALIQVGTFEKVYLIDSVLLNSKEYLSFWYTFNKSLLDNAEIIKLGFGLEQDLREMKACITGLSNIKVKGEGLLDLALLWKSLLNSGFALTSRNDIAGNSLSTLVQLCFGVPLAKTEQCSNWELRPLRSTQIHYAALDAHVLLEIYYYLQNRCLKQGIKFDEICNDVMLEGKQKSSKKLKVADRIQSSFNSMPQRSPDQIKFSVDPKLSDLLSYLRYCGFDSTVTSPTMLWHDIINLAISEDRLLLIPKMKFSPTPNYSQSSIFEVGPGNVNDQIKKILAYFRVDLKACKLLSRCVYCNEAQFKMLTSNEVHNIYNDYVKSSSYTNKYTENEYEDDDVNYDNFLSDSDCDDELYVPVSKTVGPKVNKSVPLQYEGIDKLIKSNHQAMLCEGCGKLLWEEEEIMKAAGDVINKLAKLSIA